MVARPTLALPDTRSYRGDGSRVPRSRYDGTTTADPLAVYTLARTKL